MCRCLFLYCHYQDSLQKWWWSQFKALALPSFLPAELKQGLFKGEIGLNHVPKRRSNSWCLTQPPPSGFG